ncbi:hypothetical protein [Streptomyces flaveolus]|uniref:hypothetical protein n=1 Tax=Streptomyces flaveolus TaxID=67297 RepID=UPI00167009C5|nr:hypothetical protein [Streptomyces flaveolus]GGQ93153.1 hypothetical protein GCM10010216_64430 [Streptomyces flaveolus]
MHSEPAFESRAALGEGPARGRRRKRGNGSAEGPVFVDNSGRRARLLRRLGLLVGVVCVGYAAVLGLAFMGIGTSINPSSLLPFGGGQDGRAPDGGARPQDGLAPTGAPPVGARTGAPGGQAPTATPTSGASAATD